MKQREYKVLVGTYNCGQTPPTTTTKLGNWLGNVCRDHGSVDIYLFSFQELTTVDNTSKNPVPVDMTNFNLWNDGMLRYINESRSKSGQEEVIPLWSGRLGGTMLASYVIKSMKSDNKNTSNQIQTMKTMAVECGRSKTTIKGAVCIRFCIGDKISLSFASVHFTADQETDNTEARIKDFHMINESHFDNYLFSDHDLVCFAGDLNFRVNLDRQEIVKLSEQKKYDVIIKYDQLTTAKNERKAFVDYTEGPVNFPPTYKYNKGTNQYNLSEPPHKRSPAYTDRVLYKNSEKVSVTLKEYSMGELTDSDHRPVTALFEIHSK